jgi:hypothetical protein
MQANNNAAAKEAAAKKKDEPVFEITPLEKMLQNAGPLREDGSDRFFGFENVRDIPALLFSATAHIQYIRLTNDYSLETLGMALLGQLRYKWITLLTLL